MKNLDPNKAVPQVDIPIKLFRLNNHIFFQYLSRIFNEYVETADFPNELINIKIKKYRPEHCLYGQIYKIDDNISSTHQVGYLSQHSLISVFGKWVGNPEEGEKGGALDT